MEVTPEARAHAARQLMHRAEAGNPIAQPWWVEAERGSTSILFAGPVRRRIVFRHPFDRGVTFDSLRDSITVTRSWMNLGGSHQNRSITDFRVPFLPDNSPPNGPLFIRRDESTAESSDDLLFSVLLSLSRAEEFITPRPFRDRHGRFSAEDSIAVRDGFLERPIVDELALGLEEAIHSLFPARPFTRRTLRVQLSHDVDHVGLPLNPRHTLGHLISRKNPGALLRDLASAGSLCDPTQLRCVTRQSQLSREYGLSSAFYWKASPRTAFDSGYPIAHPRVRRVIATICETGGGCGVHPGYETFESPENFHTEIDRLRTVLGDGPLGGRQHYLRWSPAMWSLWEEAGLQYDSSVGYADRVGFRAGTCHPYRPWLWKENREARLIELPLVVMDGTLLTYMGLTESESLDTISVLADRCERVGGVFTLLWHPNLLLERQLARLYEQILAMFAGTAGLDFDLIPRAFRSNGRRVNSPITA